MFVAVENWCPKQPSGARQTDVYKKEKRERLELARISREYVGAVLAGRYRNAGFRIIGELSSPDEVEIRTSWDKRLRRNPSRSLFRILAEAEEPVQ